MNINRHNYEEFFILYLDNELSVEDRREVEIFVEANPDLKEELDILMQSKIVPDESVVFEGKQELMKFQPENFIHLENYEEWLLLYTDNELNANQKATVEKFAAAHPAVKTELNLLLQARLEPELSITFPDKESLYRKEEEEKVRVIAFSWRRIAVAASLLLAIGTTAVLVVNKKENTGSEVAVTNPATKKTETAGKQAADQPAITNESNKQEVITPTIDQKEIITSKENRTGLAFEQKVRQSAEKIVSPVQQKQDEQAIASTDNINRNNLPSSRNNPYVNGTVDANSSVAKNDIRTEPSLTIPKENKATPLVTPGKAQPSDVISVAAKEPAETIDMTMPEKKSKLRGFFRKVTRTFEKTTNIKATDEDDRLLLGGLAIKL